MTRIIPAAERARRPMRPSDSIDACRARGCGGYLSAVGREVHDGEEAWCGRCGRRHVITVFGDDIYVTPDPKPRGGGR